MIYAVRYTDVARTDLLRFAAFLAETDPDLAERALANITRAMLILEEFPYSCRKASPNNPFLRELVIPFGANGYVALFHIGATHIDILAVRHQREFDYFA